MGKIIDASEFKALNMPSSPACYSSAGYWACDWELRKHDGEFWGEAFSKDGIEWRFNPDWDAIDAAMEDFCYPGQSPQESYAKEWELLLAHSKPLPSDWKLAIEFLDGMEDALGRNCPMPSHASAIAGKFYINA